MLLERDVPHLPFSAAVLKDLPVMPWSITEEVCNTCACAFDGHSKLYAGIIVTFTRPELKYFTGTLTFFSLCTYESDKLKHFCCPCNYCRSLFFPDLFVLQIFIVIRVRGMFLYCIVFCLDLKPQTVIWEVQGLSPNELLSSRLMGKSPDVLLFIGLGRKEPFGSSPYCSVQHWSAWMHGYWWCSALENVGKWKFWGQFMKICQCLKAASCLFVAL